MAKKVPFLGEEHTARANGDAIADAKKHSGRVIDEVLTAAVNPSSWDDVVVRASSNGVPETPAELFGGRIKPSNQTAVPFVQTPPFKKSAIELNLNPMIDWKPINNWHGLRIDISGSIDMSMRLEWQRLLQETHNNGIGQYEFNFTQAPSISLTGIGMLLLFKEQKGSKKGDITLCHCSKELAQLLQWSGMDKHFVIQGLSSSAEK